LRVCPVLDLQWASVRLRPLTEAECYARCYGGRREEVSSFFRILQPEEVRTPATAEKLRELFEGRPAATEPGQGLEAA
jgi:hypothetical protein